MACPISRGEPRNGDAKIIGVIRRQRRTSRPSWQQITACRSTSGSLRRWLALTTRHIARSSRGGCLEFRSVAVQAVPANINDAKTMLTNTPGPTRELPGATGGTARLACARACAAAAKIVMDMKFPRPIAPAQRNRIGGCVRLLFAACLSAPQQPEHYASSD